MLKKQETFLWMGISLALLGTLVYVTIFLSEPHIPLYIVIFGFIGAATYVLKTVTGKIAKKDFQEEYIPFHVARLAIGPSLAVILYFIISSGSVFGITLQTSGAQGFYVYSAIAFMGGYFVRHVVELFSKILDSIFNL